MKRLATIFLLLWIVSIAAFCETVAEPQDLGVLLRKNGAAFQPLELQRALKQERTPIFSTVQSTLLVVPGSRSPIRFSATQKVELYLRVFLNDSDPRAAFFTMRDPNKFSLVQLKSEDEERQIALTEIGLTYVNRQAGRPLLVRLFGEHSFLLTPSEPLAPGEYAIKYQQEDSEKYDLFCFGIDP